MPNQNQCRCGCGNPVTFISNGDSFATRPCRQRFYRATVRSARSGNADALETIRMRGWNMEANLGGGRRTGVRGVRRIASGARRFGVEIEFNGVSDVSRIIEAARVLGLTIENEGYNHATRAHWKIVRDASCGLELVSPPLSGDAGFEQVKLACRALREAGARVDRRCGLHVHIEARDVNADSVKRLIGNYSANATAINSVLARSRHQANYAGQWNAHEISAIAPVQTVEEIARRQIGRYKTVNVHSFPRYGTLEFRQHQGSVNGEKIVNWIKFCAAMLEVSTRREVRAATIEALVSSLRLDAESQSFFNERAMELAS
jgi:hypothetical protein